MKIKSSVEWPEIERALVDKLSAVSYNPDFAKLLRNIRAMVTELSKQEVTARRQHSPKICVEALDKVNGAIDQLDKYIMLAILME